MSEPVSLDPRRRPEQRRARASVERILDATAELLDENGFETLTTNAIARRAGVNVASVYKYFPNKYAVVAALGERFRDAQVDLLREALTSGRDWREALDVIMNAMEELFLRTTGFAELSATLGASPVLRPVEEESFEAEARTVAEAIPGFGLDLPRADRDAIARVMLEAVRGVLPVATRARPAARKRLLREIRRMLEAYVSSYLEADPNR